MMSPSSTIKNWTDLFRPRMLVILALGFSSGMPLALTSATLQTWQADAHVDLTTIGFFALAGISYSLKFIWAPMMDRLLPPGPFRRLGRRRGWILLTQLLLALGIGLMAGIDPLTQPILLALLAVLVAFFSASQDIVIDGLRIDYLEAREQALGAAMTIYGYQIAAKIIAGALALALAEWFGWSVSYLTMAGFMGVGMIAIILMREPDSSRRAMAQEDGKILDLSSKVGLIGLASLLGITCLSLAVFLLTRDYVLAPLGLPAWLPNFIATLLAAATPVLCVCFLPKPGQRSTNAYGRFYTWLDSAILKPFIDFASQRGWVLILLFVILYKLGDAVLGVLASAFYIDIGFSKLEIAQVTKLFGLAATLLGTFCGGVLVARLGMARALIISGILQAASNLMFSWQANIGHDLRFLYATIGVENFTGGMGGVVLVGYLSGLCNLAFSATQYALLSSMAALGRTLLSAPFGGIADAIGWSSYFLLSTLMALPGLCLLLYMMRAFPEALKARKRASP